MPLDNFSVVVKDQLFRCAQPDAEGFYSLRGLGVTDVVKLNPETGSVAAEAQYGFTVYAPQITLAQRLLNRPTKQQIVEIVTKVAQILNNGYIIAIHCQHGRDWTGAVCAAYRILHQNWSLVNALAEFKLFGATGLVGLYDHEIKEQLTLLVG